MKRNQFLNVTKLISAVKGENKKKPAQVTFNIPDELAVKLMKSMTLNNGKIQHIELSYVDKEVDGWKDEPVELKENK